MRVSCGPQWLSGGSSWCCYLYSFTPAALAGSHLADHPARYQPASWIASEWLASATSTYSVTYLLLYSSLAGRSCQATLSVGPCPPCRSVPAASGPPPSLSLIGPRGQAALSVGLHPLCWSAPASGPPSPPSLRFAPTMSVCACLWPAAFPVTQRRTALSVVSQPLCRSCLRPASSSFTGPLGRVALSVGSRPPCRSCLRPASSSVTHQAARPGRPLYRSAPDMSVCACLWPAFSSSLTCVPPSVSVRANCVDLHLFPAPLLRHLLGRQWLSSADYSPRLSSADRVLILTRPSVFLCFGALLVGPRP